ncbi:hypothetical protein HN935_04055 [archaeon]|nr:hypothetical protein [archaeon]
MNRSRYLAKYLRGKGYSTKWGGVEPFEKPEWKWNPVSQDKVDWAEVIIIVRKRVGKLFKNKFKTKGKKVIVFDVSDSQRLAPEEFRNLSFDEFQKKWTRPQLRKAIKPFLPLGK